MTSPRRATECMVRKGSAVGLAMCRQAGDKRSREEINVSNLMRLAPTTMQASCQMDACAEASSARALPTIPPESKDKAADVSTTQPHAWLMKQIITAAPCTPSAFSVATQFRGPTGKRMNVREECHWSHACKSVKPTCVGIQWHSSGVNSCRKTQAPCHAIVHVSMHVGC
jgi:hypothetical protein